MDALEDPRVLVGMAVIAVTVVSLYLSNSLPLTSKPKVALSGPDHVVPFTLTEKEHLTHDTRRFRFALPSPDHVLGLPVGQHISLRYTDKDGKLVARSYTPVTSDDERGYMDLVIKVYFKDVHPKFPNGGKMSQYLNDMKIGEQIDVSGPKGKLEYLGRGTIAIRHRPRDVEPEIKKASKVGMIAGGTGITPMLQIIRKALKDPEDKTEFHLLLANQTEGDILCREEVTEMTKNHSNVRVWYTVDKAPNDQWPYSVGFVSAAMMKDHLPAPGDDTMMLMCGPPPMLKFAVLPALEELQYSPKMHFSF